MLKGLGTRLRMVQTHWWNAGESCTGPLPRILTWWYRWLVRWVLLLCVPKHAPRPHITLKPILQTLITSVWMVSRSNGLDGTDFFHKIPPNLSKVIFQYMWSHCFFAAQIRASDKIIPADLGVLSGMPPPSSIIQRGEHYPEPWTTPRSFPSLFDWRERYVIQYSNIGASKEEGNYAYYLGVGGKLHLWSYAS